MNSRRSKCCLAACKRRGEGCSVCSLVWLGSKCSKANSRRIVLTPKTQPQQPTALNNILLLFCRLLGAIRVCHFCRTCLSCTFLLLLYLLLLLLVLGHLTAQFNDKIYELNLPASLRIDSVVLCIFILCC